MAELARAQQIIRTATGNVSVDALVTIVTGTSPETLYAIPAPSTYDATSETMVDGARNASGQFIGDYIGEKWKISLSWKFISAADWATLLQKFSQRKYTKCSDGTSPTLTGKFVNTVRFYAQDVNEWVEAEMYVGDRTAGVFKRASASPYGVEGYTGAKLSLIEV